MALLLPSRRSRPVSPNVDRAPPQPTGTTPHPAIESQCLRDAIKIRQLTKVHRHAASLSPQLCGSGLSPAVLPLLHGGFSLSPSPARLLQGAKTGGALSQTLAK